jgi:hypothetical protein
MALKQRLVHWTEDMKHGDTENSFRGDFYFEEIHPNVWLMDDHRWAYYIWERSLEHDLRTVLVNGGEIFMVIEGLSS